MGFHEYRAIWTPHENKVLHACMEPTNKKDKFAVAVISHKNSSSPLPLPPSGMRCRSNASIRSHIGWEVMDHAETLS